MTKSKIFLSLVTMALLTSCETASTRATDSSVTSPESLRTTLSEFISSAGEAGKSNRSVGSLGHEKSFLFLKSEFDKLAKKYGGTVYVHEFMPDIDFAVKNYQKDFDTKVKSKFSSQSPVYKKWNAFTVQAIKFVKGYQGRKGHNLILEFKGTSLPEEVFYVGAHYDTITHNHETMQFTPEFPAPGADDNASGVAAVLAAAKTLASEKHDRTLRFVAFDYEEIFFLGSYALAKDLSSQKLKWSLSGEKQLGLYNLEMIGWLPVNSGKNSEAKPVVKLYTRVKNSAGFEADTKLASFFQKGVILSKAPLTSAILDNGFDRSDNWSFWQWSYPSVCVSQDWEKSFNEANYHTPHDTVESLNYDYLSQITLSLIATLEEVTRKSSWFD